VQITASDRADTVVEVRPSDESDVKAAQQTRVEYADGAISPSTGQPPEWAPTPPTAAFASARQSAAQSF
jgi:hypothetical protein